MFRTAVVAAFVAAASAAAWPMITVNSAGEIVLNSPAKAGSFQLNAVTVTSAPTSSGTASRSTVTALDADTDAFIVNVPSSPATSAGYKLPSATEGRTIRFYNSGSGKGAFTIWTASTSVFIDGTSSTTIDIASTTSYVVATATSSTNWVISQNAARAAASTIGYTAAATSAPSAATTLTTAQFVNGYYVSTPTAAFTLTTPTASELTALNSNSANGDSYRFTITSIAAAVLATDITITLAGGTGVTVPSDGTQLIIPGQTRTYVAYRTGSAAWTLYQESTWQKFSTTALDCGTLATTVACTAHANRFTATLTATTGAAANVITNNYAQLGDWVLVSPIAAASAAGVDNDKCGITAANTITCNDFSAAGTQQHELRVIKYGLY